MALEDAKSQVDQAFTRENSRGLSYENSFGGALSFLRRRYSKDLTGVDLAVTGVPFDQAVTNRPGARLGPRAVREASALQVFDPPYGWDGFSPLEEFDIVDCGDLAFDYANVPAFPAALTEHIRGHPQGRSRQHRPWRGSLYFLPDSTGLRREIRAAVLAAVRCA